MCVRPFCSSFVSLTVSIHTYLEHRHVRDLSLLLLFFHQLAPCYLVEFHLLPLLIYIRNIFIAFQENAHIHPRDWTVINLDWRSIFFFQKSQETEWKKKKIKNLKNNKIKTILCTYIQYNKSDKYLKDRSWLSVFFLEGGTDKRLINNDGGSSFK